MEKFLAKISRYGRNFERGGGISKGEGRHSKAGFKQHRDARISKKCGGFRRGQGKNQIRGKILLKQGKSEGKTVGSGISDKVYIFCTGEFLGTQTYHQSKMFFR